MEEAAALPTLWIVEIFWFNLETVFFFQKLVVKENPQLKKSPQKEIYQRQALQLATQFK